MVPHNKVPITEININGTTTLCKECTGCKIVKPLGDFNSSKVNSGGRQPRCKECLREYRRDNFEKRKHYYENIERFKKRPSSVLRSRRWKLNNPLKIKATDANREARSRGLQDSLTYQELEEVYEYFNHSCALSGEKEDLHLDHFISMDTGKVGSIKGNLVPLSAYLNVSKRNLNPFEWIKTKSEYQKQFDNLVSYLAELNEMSNEHFKRYVYECYSS